jgi:hypothetical protein
MNPEQIKHLWRLLGQTYGQRWAEQYGPTPNEAWTAYLSTIEPERAKHGLHKVIHSGSPFPPTLPEFIGYVKTFRPAARVMQIDEQRTPADAEKARQNIERIRQMLRT